MDEVSREVNSECLESFVKRGGGSVIISGFQQSKTANSQSTGEIVQLHLSC